MIKKLLACFLAALFLLGAASCGNSPAANTDGVVTDEKNEHTTAPAEVSSFFGKDSSIMFENGVYSNVNGELEDVVFSEEKYSASGRYDFKVTFASAGGRLRLYFDVKKAEDGSIKSGHMLQLNALNSRISLYEIDGNRELQLGTARYLFTKNTEHAISLRNLSKSISVHVGVGEAEEYPVINVSCTRPSEAIFGVCFCGGNKVTVSEPLISENYAPAEGNRYKNPMLPDTVIADPTVLFYEGTYYMFTTGSFVCRTSTDLVNWKTAGSVAPQSGLYGTKYFGGAGIYERDGVFYMTYTSHQTSDSGISVFYATASTPLGPYEQKGTMEEHILLSENNPAGSFLFRDPVSGKDILYFYRTDSGSGNVIYGTNIKIENGTIKVTDKSPTKLITPTENWEKKNENGVTFPVCERPNVIYHNGYYYIFYAGSHYKTSYSEGYAVSDKLLEGFVKPKDTNPLLDATSSITGGGCTWIVPSPNGQELFVLYHCHDANESFYKRRLCMDRLGFRTNPDGGYDIPVIYGPTATYQPAPAK